MHSDVHKEHGDRRRNKVISVYDAKRIMVDKFSHKCVEQLLPTCCIIARCQTLQTAKVVRFSLRMILFTEHNQCKIETHCTTPKGDVDGTNAEADERRRALTARSFILSIDYFVNTIDSWKKKITIVFPSLLRSCV